MSTYVQFDNSGNITSVVNSMTAPVCTNQIKVADGTNLAGMMVNTTTMALQAAPPPSGVPAAVAAAMAAGIVLTSTGTPALNGTYAIDQQSQDNVTATMTYIEANGTFPGGSTTMPWIDQNNNEHTWPSIAEFKAFATAFANYVEQVAIYADSNGAVGSLPSNAITIS